MSRLGDEMDALGDGAAVLTGAVARGGAGFGSRPQAQKSEAKATRAARLPIMRTDEYGDQQLNGK